MALSVEANAIDISQLPPLVQWVQGNVRVTYEARNVDLSTDDGWPPYMSCRPNVGEMVESTNGRRLEILEVVHVVENRKATLKVVLGHDISKVTPMEGGENYVAMEPE